MEKYPVEVQQSDHALNVGRFLSQHTVHDVLRVAVAMADRQFRAWCESWGHGPEMENAFTILQEAFKISKRLLQESSPTTIEILLRIGDFHKERLFRKGKRKDAEQALQAYREVRIRDPSNMRAMVMLGFVYQYQYDMTGERWLLDKSIDTLSEAMTVGSSLDPLMIDALLFAAVSFKERAQFDGCADDLDVMIEILRLALNSPAHFGDSPALVRLVLAEGLSVRYDILEHDEDLSEAERLIATVQNFELYRDLVKGGLFQIRFQKFRQHKDIVASAQAYQNALSGIEKDSASPLPMKFSICIQLAQVLREGYHKEPAPLMLYGAKIVAQCFWADAMARCEDWRSNHFLAEGHLRLAEIQRSRYYRHLTLDILDESVSHFRQSVKLTSPQDARFGVRAARLAAILRAQFKAIQTPSYRISDARREAVSLIGQLVRARFPFKPSDAQECLMEIGDLVQDLCQEPQTVDLLDKALSHYSKAVSIECTDFSQNVELLVRVAQILTDKGDLTGKSEYYETAQTYIDKIEVLAKKRRCQTTGHLPLLAWLLEAKFNLMGDPDQGRRALEKYYDIFHNSNYEVYDKIIAARRYTRFMSRLSLKADDYSKKLLQILEDSDFISIKFFHAITYTVDLMLQLISDGLSRKAQLTIIRREASTPVLCVYYCIYLKKSAFEMVQLYERGRSVLWDRLINSKTQTDMLEEQHKELAARYRELRRLLASSEEHDPRITSMPQDRYQTAADLDDVIKEIHGKPGFEDFLLLPLSQTEMQNFASEGPIIYLVAGIGDGAGVSLTISLHSVSTVNLPRFSEKQCRWCHNQLQRAFSIRDDAPSVSDQLLGDSLKWLWYSAAQPTLQALGLLSTKKGLDPSVLPRLWWVTSNWASRLPIHAAGDYSLAKEKALTCTVMDNVISSYTPTLRALKYSRSRLEQLKQQASRSSKPGKMLLVAMHDTPDRPKLDDAVPEVVLVSAILEPHLKARLLISPQVSRRDVILNLHDCTIAHLACHGEADQADPLRSKLLFWDWGPKPLRVGFLMRMELMKCQLAFLSACQTAVNQDEALAEEGLHLSGAFQMAGVPNVIATMWNILDKEAIGIAIQFYMGLKNEGGELDVTRSARSLHATLVDMRNRGLSPYIWGSYAHFGA
ncbi:MAG: hypothetical protein HETSPECPRED_000021 [Heterodermia speciosa]|uniref:CHAT domain-containing protein n=1 Tax=Heterodermia speciosa TaxID=116794 RepID=A0A8H3ECC5_9LECA|nr:MAG: hypothetical protein HETSPECPRED_000021 [Heterodermia speciosa]